MGNWCRSRVTTQQPSVPLFIVHGGRHTRPHAACRLSEGLVRRFLRVLRASRLFSKMSSFWSLTTFLPADEGEELQAWGTPSVSDDHDESPPSSPSFAPVGRPMVRKRFRTNLPDPLPLNIPPMNRLSSLRHSYSVSICSLGHSFPTVWD